MTNQELVDQTARAYLYGFPLVADLDQVHRYVTAGVGSTPAAPFNTLAHTRTLAGPAETFVSINNDTVYTQAQLDLSVGPVTLHVPDTAGRYYVMQFVDAWTDNFAYVGKRATGTDAGDFLLVPPGWTGSAPDGVTVIEFPTRIASIVGRWACSGVDDLPAVHALQDATTLTPQDPAAKPAGLPTPDPKTDPDLLFLEKLRIWSQAFPPAPRDHALQDSYKGLGIDQPGPSPYTQPDAALSAGIEAGKKKLEYLLTHTAGAPVNGWQVNLHIFDYNLDYFQVGTIDSPQYKITDPEQRIADRAIAARAGLWGNNAYEAAYFPVYVDDQGQRLDGANTYTLRLDPTPPVGAFWSLTMYSVPDFYLVDNPIDRYSLGDRTPGIVYADDGSLTITISHTAPTDPTARANWLPSPAGEFRPLMRMNQPEAAVLDLSYVLPPIIKS
ncbi:DUF1254 domain-containing protein [Nocardia sp. NPDC058705]|uniref:DUF1254 domain-containing protein n=1 Tax=Nocardia sp. NPDC058705 TaxID=3346609 RepID=UPI0036889D5D